MSTNFFVQLQKRVFFNWVKGQKNLMTITILGYNEVILRLKIDEEVIFWFLIQQDTSKMFCMLPGLHGLPCILWQYGSLFFSKQALAAPDAFMRKLSGALQVGGSQGCFSWPTFTGTTVGQQHTWKKSFRVSRSLPQGDLQISWNGLMRRPLWQSWART